MMSSLPPKSHIISTKLKENGKMLTIASSLVCSLLLKGLKTELDAPKRYCSSELQEDRDSDCNCTSVMELAISSSSFIWHIEDDVPLVEPLNLAAIQKMS